MAYNSLTIPMVLFVPFNHAKYFVGPYAYRMLPSLLFTICAKMLSPVVSRFPGLHFPKLNPPLETNEQWFMMLLCFGALFGALMSARWMLRAIDSRPAFEWLALALGYMAYFDTILALNRNLFYPYDITSIFFFTLLVALAFRGRPVLFALVLVVSMLNRETAIMTVLVYFGLQYERVKISRLLLMTSGMAILAMGVRVMQTEYLHHVNPVPQQAQVETHHWAYNLHQMLNPLFWVSDLAIFGYGYVALFFFWKYVPITVRRTFLVVSGIWGAGMFVVGVLREIRIFSELSALLLLTVALGIHGWLEVRRSQENSGTVSTSV